MTSLFLHFRWFLVLSLWLMGSVLTQVKAAPTDDTQAVIAALAKSNQAVVGVHVRATSGARSSDGLGQVRSGSGVVIGSDGLILTIGYLILEAQHIQIMTQDDKVYPAQVVAYDLSTGFGLIRSLVPLKGITPVKFGELKNVEIGEVLMAASGTQIDGDEADVNMTHLVHKRAFTGTWEYHIESAIFTSPPVEKHSGAPLFNQLGELVGIGSLFVLDAIGPSQPHPGNMFVPVDLLVPILAELRVSGSSSASTRPWLGMNTQDNEGKIQVQRVGKESPAHAAGLRPGDVVLAVDGNQVSTLESFYKSLWSRSPPEVEVELTVLQGSEIKTLVVKAVNRLSTLRKAEGI
ncbi:MAG: S1C family serine protease [Burkholderiaceae bacterium]